MKKMDESLFSLANIQRQYVQCRRHKRNTANAFGRADFLTIEKSFSPGLHRPGFMPRVSTHRAVQFCGATSDFTCIILSIVMFEGTLLRLYAPLQLLETTEACARLVSPVGLELR